ncbi:hypothetical protein GCM10025778_07370 [Paeniglutamicibacter antarcticus]|uniref:Uncharacterized protein n=1 Tax=Paeniglutamicibacter antarcticus TaxID=494023 RepID=A0ABP9TI10_9MICC
MQTSGRLSYKPFEQPLVSTKTAAGWKCYLLQLGPYRLGKSLAEEEAYQCWAQFNERNGVPCGSSRAGQDFAFWPAMIEEGFRSVLDAPFTHRLAQWVV